MSATLPAILSFILLSLVILFPAQMLAARVCPQASPWLRLLIGSALTIFFIAALVALLAMLGVRPQVTTWILRGGFVLLLFFGLKNQSWKILFSPEILPGLSIFFAYFLFASQIAAFPTSQFSDLRASTAQSIFGLPIDNLIPYNVSRYFVEDISPQQLEVVPTWNFVDRGPLAGLFTAAIFLLLGIQETGHWLVPQPGMFGMYQFCLQYLNLLSLFAVWLVLRQVFNRSAAVIGTLTLCSSYFFLANSVFTWPKFLAAFFVSTACFAWSGGVSAVWVGLLFGAAILSHDSGYFSLVMFLVYALLVATRSRSDNRSEMFLRPRGQLFGVLGGLLCSLGPWMLYKQLSGAPASRVMLLNAFCIQTVKTKRLTLWGALNDYLKEHSWWQLVEVRLENLWYPFNVFYPFGNFQFQSKALYEFAFVLKSALFFQFIYAVGPVFLLVAVVMLCRARRSREMKLIGPFICAGLGAFLPAAAMLGCEQTSFNHIWAYGACMAVAMLVAWAFEAQRWWMILLFAFAFAANILMTYVLLFFEPASFVFQHADASYWTNLTGATMLLITSFLYAAVGEDKRQ